MGLQLDRWVIAWTPARPPWSDGAFLANPGDIAALDADDTAALDYARRAGMCDPALRNAPDNEKKAALFRILDQCITRDGIDEATAKQEFMKIDAFR